VNRSVKTASTGIGSSVTAVSVGFRLVRMSPIPPTVARIQMVALRPSSRNVSRAFTSLFRTLIRSPVRRRVK
jgi:hypothetical protein